MTPLLCVQDLAVRVGTRAVDGVSFAVAPGEVAALVGESGSGKSVSALSVMRLLPRDAAVTGWIELDGHDVLALPEGKMRSLRGGTAGMIFQEPLTSLNPVLTVGFQIAETLRSGFFGRARAYVHAVEGVSFALDAGETLALLGESGCGKSTTGRSILGLSEPLSGSVRFEGADVLQHPPAALRRFRRDVQMIFQDPFGSLDPRQTVGSAIGEPIRVHGIAGGAEVGDRVAHLLLRRVGLDPGLGGRFPHAFSGGQRQRICIARALGLAPKLVIADEAVSALDVSTKAQVIELLMDLQAEFGLSYLLISHNLAAVERVSHRVAVIRPASANSTGEDLLAR